MTKYYCPNCKDKLCEKCLDLPWECPETTICSSCKEEMKTIVTKLYVLHQQGKIEINPVDKEKEA